MTIFVFDVDVDVGETLPATTPCDCLLLSLSPYLVWHLRPDYKKESDHS